MTKILYIVTQPEFGGAQRYIFDLATNLDKSQYDIHITAGGPEGMPASSAGELFARLQRCSSFGQDRARGQNLALHSLKHLVRPISPIHDFLCYSELKKLISEIKPDIVHLNSSKAGVLGSLAAKRLGTKKIIYTAHGFVFNEPMNPFKRWLYKKAEQGTAKRVDTVIAVSEFDRQAGIKAGIDENKIMTIHNGIDLAQMNFLTKEEAILSLRGASSALRATRQSYQRTEARLSTNAPQRDVKIASPLSTRTRNDKIIGAIANFYQTKGLDVLIDAMTNIDAQLVIIGDGELRPQLERQIKKLNLSDRVTLAGHITDGYRFLKAFDLFVLPSRKEGFPYVLLEAAAAGIPMVATRVGGVPEIIQDGVTGYLADPNNPDALAQKINQALREPLAPRLPDDCTLAAMLEKTRYVYEN